MDTKSRKGCGYKLKQRQLRRVLCWTNLQELSLTGVRFVAIKSGSHVSRIENLYHEVLE